MDWSTVQDCPECHGEGTIHEQDVFDNGEYARSFTVLPCWFCGGRGWMPKATWEHRRFCFERATYLRHKAERLRRVAEVLMQRALEVEKHA